MAKKLKTRRGVFINVEDSDIVIVKNGKTYKFSSIKKREMYLKRVYNKMLCLSNVYGKIYRIVGLSNENYIVDFGLSKLIDKIYENTYNEMQYK